MPLSILAAVGFLVAVQPVTERPAKSGAIKARHEVCYALATAGGYPALNIADCLSFDSAPDAVFNTQVCNFLRETEQLRDYEFRSYADCIQRGVTR